MRIAARWLCLLLLTGCSKAQPTGTPLVDAFPALRFTQPVDLQAPPDGSPRLFVVEQTGRIKVVPTAAGTPAATTFLDLSSLIASGGELGLLGLAFHPQYAQNRTFFVFYTRRGAGGAAYEEVVARYRASATDPNVADPASGEVLLAVPDPYSNHNGGQLQFGPDGYLYVALGDGGSGGDPQGNGQNTGALLGSILRLDVDARAGSLAPECGGAGAYRVPGRQPLRRADRRVRGDLRLRPAQPVALLVRPGWHALGGRCGAGRVGGGGPRGEGRQLRLECSRRHALLQRDHLRHHRPAPARPRVRPQCRRRLLDHRRIRAAGGRWRVCGPCGLVRLRRLRDQAHLGAARATPARRRRWCASWVAPRAWRCPRSGSMRAGGCSWRTMPAGG